MQVRTASGSQTRTDQSKNKKKLPRFYNLGSFYITNFDSENHPIPSSTSQLQFLQQSKFLAGLEIIQQLQHPVNLLKTVGVRKTIFRNMGSDRFCSDQD